MSKLRSARATAMAAAAMLLLCGAQACLAQVEFTVDIVRQSKANQDEGGLCAKVNWPGITRDTYVRWLEGVMIGTTKVNKFASGNCQYDEVTSITSRSGRRCVQYTWHNCQKG